MNQPTWLDYVTAIGAVATPILVLVLAGIGWRIRSRMEREFSLEDQMREDRIATYNAILKPFIILLTTNAAWQSDPKNKNKSKDSTAVQTLLSVEYREQGFSLSLVGSDAVVRAYNNLMQYFYQREGIGSGSESAANCTRASAEDAREMMALLGQFLLEIRRSVGNEKTKVDNWDMLEWFMKDARRLRPKGGAGRA